MQIADERVRKVIYGAEDDVLHPKRSYRLQVTNAPEAWVMTCSCEDFQRHAEQQMTPEDLEKRKKSSKDVEVVGESSKYGVRVFTVVTRGKNGNRYHEVTLAKGGGSSWVCKHMIAVLYSGKLTPGTVEVLWAGEGMTVNGCARCNLASGRVGMEEEDGRIQEVCGLR